ncbi:MAG: enolase C-terminal domain-like protein, partial [Thiohalocapsa sp.]
MSLRLGIRPYRLPLRRPWISARGEVRERVGWLVIASAGSLSGFGDCSPLPEAGTETGSQAERRLEYWGNLPLSTIDDNAIASLLDALPCAEPGPTPAADCAVETALLDLRARRRGLPLRLLLAADAADQNSAEQRAADQILVNAALGIVATLTQEQIATASAEGYRVFKVKVGTAAPADELALIQAAALALPQGGSFRLDANGAWDRHTAACFIAGLDGLPIDCLEEPLQVPDHADLAALQAVAPFAIALDETLPRCLRRRPRADRHPQHDPQHDPTLDLTGLPVRRLVLKPGVLGGLRSTLRLARLARAAGREVV